MQPRPKDLDDGRINIAAVQRAVILGLQERNHAERKLRIALDTGRQLAGKFIYRESQLSYDGPAYTHLVQMAQSIEQKARLKIIRDVGLLLLIQTGKFRVWRW
ncbi:MAG: hypothetical protein JOZ14_16815 [Acidobacteria bacterium]|nr:hypothetical protein [Acidobacteriota bacterium]